MERFERRTLFEIAIVMAACSGVVAAILIVLTGLSAGVIAIVALAFWAVSVAVVVVLASG